MSVMYDTPYIIIPDVWPHVPLCYKTTSPLPALSQLASTCSVPQWRYCVTPAVVSVRYQTGRPRTVSYIMPGQTRTAATGHGGFDQLLVRRHGIKLCSATDDKAPYFEQHITLRVAACQLYLDLQHIWTTPGKANKVCRKGPIYILH